MRHHSLPIGIFAIAFGLLLNAAPAWAVAETWVSGTGSDTGNCPITAPCQTFQYAHGKTTNGGAINVLSSGNFGPLTVTKSISIVAQGVEAVINTAAGGAAIKINTANIVVSLRGLTVDLRGTATTGISFGAGTALHVHNCVIRGATDGIIFAPASGTGQLHVSDSVIADTGIGITVRPGGSASAKVLLDRVRTENASFHGIFFLGTSTTGFINATVRDSVAAGNGSVGIHVVEDSGEFEGTTTVMVDRSASVNNLSGIRVTGTGGMIRIGDSTISGNGTGLFANVNGRIVSYGTNKVHGNVTDGAPTGSPIAMK